MVVVDVMVDVDVVVDTAVAVDGAKEVVVDLTLGKEGRVIEGRVIDGLVIVGLKGALRVVVSMGSLCEVVV